MLTRNSDSLTSVLEHTTGIQYIVQDDEFERDDGKASRNIRAHGVAFEAAREVFRDVFAVAWTDDRRDDTEERFVTVGMV